MSDPPPKAGALFSVGNKVQISWKYSDSVYRGQTGIINKMKRKGGSGKLKDNWVYSITFDGSAFANKENGTLELFEEFLSTTILLGIANKYVSMSAESSESIDAYRDILKVGKRPKESLDLLFDGGMLSMRRSFSLKEYKELFKAAGYPEGSLKCQSLFRPTDPISYTCRVVCVADLTLVK